MSKQPQLSSTYARIILQTAEMEPDLLLAGTTLTPTSINQSEFIAWSAIATLFHNFAGQQRSPAWTAEIGSRLSTVSHGPLGFAALTAPTLGDAIKVMGSYAEVRQSAIRTGLRLEKGRYYLSLEDLTGDADFSRWTSEIIVKIIELLLEAILGHPVGPNVLIRFSHTAPARGSELAAAYSSKVEFDARETSISIPEVWRHLPSPLHDDAVFRANISKCRQIVARQHEPVDMMHRVNRRLNDALEENMMRGSHISQLPTMTALAAGMHLTPRTLIRHLKSEGTTYTAIVEELRRQAAGSLLRDASLNIAEISELLGYREPASFVRAFKKWYGKPPTAWRRQV